MDDAFGALIDHLRTTGLYDRTMIVFTSDHGEEFNEHGFVGWHSHSLYDELLKVPLIIKFPGSGDGGTSVPSQVRSIDIAPTIVKFLGLPVPADFQGVDLSPLIAGESLGPLAAVSRMDRPPNRERSSIRTEEWKLAGPPRRRSLFDLTSDPGEQWDRSLKDAAVAAELQERLDALVDAYPPLEPTEVAPDDKTLDELRDLGYLN
jgi:arylsulfatase A-like enzyme